MSPSFSCSYVTLPNLALLTDQCHQTAKRGSAFTLFLKHCYLLYIPTDVALEFLKGTLGVKWSVHTWAVLCECGHERLELLSSSTMAYCPPIVPPLSRSFTLISSFSLGLILARV